MITDLDYHKYKKLLSKGHSQREACLTLGIARSTMQDYIARSYKFTYEDVKNNPEFKAKIKKSVKTSQKISADGAQTVFLANGASIEFSPPFKGPIAGFKPREDNSRILCISDLHIPHEHPQAFEFLQHLKEKYNPTRVICMGDELDKHALSFHDSDPDLDSAGAEMKKSLVKIKALHKMFPKMDILDSNHGSLVYRKAKAHGIPKHFLKGYNEFLEVDSGWQWHFDLTIKLPNGQDCYFHHGKTNRIGELSQKMGMCAAAGHYHSDFCIHYWANPNQLLWGLQTGCVDADTEFMSEHGWVKIKDYTNQKVLQYLPDNTAEFVVPDQFIKLPCSHLNHFETKYGVSQTLCNDHRVVYLTRNKNLKIQNFSEVKALHEKNINGFEGKFITSFIGPESTGMPLSDAMIRLQVAVNADGTIPRTKANSSWCKITLRKQRKIDRLISLLTSAGVDYEMYTEAKINTCFKFFAPMHEKRFNNSWLNCTRSQLKVIAEEVLHWDGNCKNMFYTTIKEEADFVQYVFASQGIHASISTVDQEPNNLFRVIVSQKRNLRSIGSSSSNTTKVPITTVETTDGFKYCFKVPSGMLVLRNSDCIFITGNCLIDNRNPAFSYANVNIKHQIIGTGLIIDSLPVLEPMIRDKNNRWIGA